MTCGYATVRPAGAAHGKGFQSTSAVYGDIGRMLGHARWRGRSYDLHVIDAVPIEPQHFSIFYLKILIGLGQIWAGHCVRAG